MTGLFQTQSSGICADSLRAWPWLCLLLLSGVTWFLPLSPAVSTLESNPRPPFTAPVEDEAEKINTTQTDNYLEKALKAAGCDSGISAFGQDCSLLKNTLGTMNSHILQGQRDDVEDEEGTEEDFPWNRDPDIMPELQVNCWCPAQFESSHVAYTNRVCGNKINRHIRGLEEGGIYGDVKFVPPRTSKPMPEKMDRKFDDTGKNVTERKVYVNRRKVYVGYNAFITHKVSFLFFVFALVLLIPSLLWRKISASIWCGVNIDKTLDMLRVAQSYELEARRRTYKGIARETKATVKTSGRTAKSFLLCKTLACCASLVVIFLIFQMLQPQATTLSTELEELSDISKLYPLQDHFLFHCFFTIKQTQNAHDYTVQCLTSFQPSQVSGSAGMTNGDVYHQLDSARRTLLVYTALFQAVTAFLVLHATLNICGAVEWTWRFFIDTDRFSAHTTSGDPGFSGDVRFFLCCAHEQLGHVVSGELAESFAQATTDNSGPCYGSGRKGDDMEDNV